MSQPLLVVALRGTINIPAAPKRTLAQLHLSRRYRATIVPADPVHRGMLAVVKNYVAWSGVDASLIEALLAKRGKVSHRKKLSVDEVSSLGFKNLKTLAAAIAKGKADYVKFRALIPSFSLAPPRGGFKRSTKRMYRDGGLLGENPELAKIVERML